MQVAHSVRHLGDVYRHARRTPSVATTKRLPRGEDSPPTLDFANAVRPMAILQADLGRRAEALTLWREARDLYAAVGIADGVEEAERWLERLT